MSDADAMRGYGRDHDAGIVSADNVVVPPGHEAERLVQGLEAFAYATGVERRAFLSALERVVGKGAAGSLPARSPYRLPPPDEQTPARKLSWVDRRGRERAWISLVDPVADTPRAWRWWCLAPRAAEPDAGDLSGESLSFTGAYAKVVEHLGAELGSLAAIPEWASPARL